MQLTERIREEFAEGDRERGDNYFGKDRVRIVDESPTYIAAMVHGSYDIQYFVQVDVAGTEAGFVSASCECPRFDDGYPCKHIWATLRCMDEDGTSSGDSRLQLIAESTDQLTAATTRRRNVKPDYETVIAAKKNSEMSTGWRKKIRDLAQSAAAVSSTTTDLQKSRSDQQSWYVLSIADQQVAEEIQIDLYISSRRKTGDWGKPIRRRIEKRDISSMNDPLDRRILKLIGRDEPSYGYQRLVELKLDSEFISDVVPLLCDTGRFVWCLSADRALESHHPLAWDPGQPWRLKLRLARQAVIDEDLSPPVSTPEQIELTAELVRDDHTLPIGDVIFASIQGLLLTQTHAARLNPFDASLLTGIMKHGRITAAYEELDSLLAASLSEIPFLPEIEFADGIDVACDLGQPEAVLEILDDDMEGSRTLLANVLFRYGNVDVPKGSPEACLWDASRRRMLRRNHDRESAFLAMLVDLPLRSSNLYYHNPQQLILHVDDLHEVVFALADKDWNVVAHGRRMRRAGAFDIHVTSGTDWFDVTAHLKFGDHSAGLPELLKAIRQQRKHVVLDDGSYGLLPDDWLQKCQRFANIAVPQDEVLRFSKSQAMMLDAMLAEQDNVTVDRSYSKLIKKLQDFDGIATVKQPAAFRGELRGYQQEGLGWLYFLRDFGFGGCLADDMGLGKTVQVLAMLQARRSRRTKPTETRNPSIVVVPKSLVFNWIEEANRFTPKLRVINFTGVDRGEQWNELTKADIVVTTYGTLRRDIAQLRQIRFDYAILDESQAIKNSKSQSSKACRLLNSDYRLAMTGTPVENHLGELWTLLEFLNPGMLGSESAFRKLSAKSDTESLAWLGHALRPFVLRRTKSQVLTELPEKTEQTLYCEMEPKQRNRYNELRDYYRSHIGNKVKEVGVQRAKIHVLEALLRLRQAACDPRLLDATYPEPGAKIEQLLMQLQEVLEEGHKALVFSQFTSLLALVRATVEQRGWDYEYLDGKTRKRAECVQRFQSDDACKLFLISLKAGGHGLNLTAADYVFILDPWWNPAVEAQAIDRAHRIGQTRPVMAYRLICRDTVEDNIIKLQQSKRDLADAIITANESLISKLSLDDLHLLFG